MEEKTLDKHFFICVFGCIYSRPKNKTEGKRQFWNRKVKRGSVLVSQLVKTSDVHWGFPVAGSQQQDTEAERPFYLVLMPNLIRYCSLSGTQSWISGPRQKEQETHGGEVKIDGGGISGM